MEGDRFQGGLSKGASVIAEAATHLGFERGGDSGPVREGAESFQAPGATSAKPRGAQQLLYILREPEVVLYRAVTRAGTHFCKSV